MGVTTVSVTRRIRALAAATVVAGCLVAGCSDTSPTPKPLPSKSSTAHSPSSGAPQQPPAATRGSGSSAAEAFVRYYVKTLNLATTSGDTKALRSLDDGSCKSCRGVTTAIEDVYAAGGNIRTIGWQIRDLEPVRFATTSTVQAKVALSPQLVTKRHGAKAARYKGGHLQISFKLSRTENGWLVDELERGA